MIVCTIHHCRIKQRVREFTLEMKLTKKISLISKKLTQSLQANIDRSVFKT